MQNFMKMRSQSYRTYYELLEPFNLNPTDYAVSSYIIPKMKTSAKHGEHGKDGKCFYRHDDKVKGIYYATTITILINKLPFKISRRTLERSFTRLEHYGILFESQTVKTNKNGIQIFMPILDEDIRRYFNDKNYHTAINIKTKDGKKYKNGILDNVKMTFSTVSKWLYRECQNGTLNNDHIMNHHGKKDHVYNDSHDGQNHQSNNNENKSDNKYKIKSFGLPNNVMDLISNSTSSTREAMDCVTNIGKGKQDGNMKFWYKDIYGSVYYKNEDNPYIQNYLEPKLKKWLSKMKTPKDLRNAVEMDYLKYMCSHTDFQLKNKQANSDRHLYANWNIYTYQDNLKINYENMKKYKGSDTKEYNKAKKRYDQLNDLAKRYLNVPMEYVDYSKKDIAVSKHSKPHKVDPKLIANVKKSLYDLNHKGGITTDSNGVQHAHVNRSIYSDRRKPKQHYALH